MSEYVENKDREGVSKLYDEAQAEEFMMCHLLNEHLPKELRHKGYFFEMQSNGNQYSHHDLEFVKIGEDRSRTLIAKIEFEYGKMQTDWDYTMPRKRWYGINLLTRKDYGINFDLFIKSSPTFNSFFAVDCRDGYMEKHFLRTIDSHSSSVGITTNERKFEIPWSMVETHQFKFDNVKKKIEDKNFCLVEDTDDWRLFYRFLWKRFLDGSKGNKK